MARTYFRLVRSDPPTRGDFLSLLELGRGRPGASSGEIHLLRGVSMFEREDQARALALERSTRFEHVAEILVPDVVRVDRQGRRAGHVNVYAPADDLLKWVVRVVPVR
jgi:hypothetical protein